jgi:hypothetical protein
METTKLINWKDQIYIGKHTSNQTLEGYANALAEVIERYAKPYRCSRWVCTSTFGFGEGHRENYDVKGWKFGEGDVFGYVNRAFKNAGIENEIKAYQNFNHIPSGGVFEASNFLNYLKSKLN